MTAAGLKPATIWVLNVNAPAYEAKIERACPAINASRDSKIVPDGMLELADVSDWT